MDGTWTIRRVVEWTAKDFAGRGIDSARLDADLLVAHALGLPRVGLYLDLDRPLTAEELSAIRALVVRRRGREPIAYIVGQREFYGRPFTVSPAVLVPRPDTETLVEQALARLGEDDARVLDLCTGSGCVGLTLAAERPSIQVDLTDVSAAALAVAQQNAEALGVADRVAVLEGDLFAALPEPRKYAMIVANPPYVLRETIATLDADVAVHEPKLALDGGEDGLDVVRRIADQAAAHLSPGGWLLIEIGAGQARAVVDLLASLRFVDAESHADLGGVERVVAGRLDDAR